MKTVVILTGTNIENGKRLLNKEFNEMSWWSDNYETVAHYYEGSVIQMTVSLDPDKEQEYVRESADLTVPVSEYTYGIVEVRYPPDAIWYSFSGAYLKEHVISTEEIFPDLSMYNEED